MAKSGPLNLLLHCSENSIYVFPEIKLRSLVPNSYIHVSVSNFHISRNCLSIWLQQNRQSDPAHIYMNVEIGRQNITVHIILFWK